MKLKLGVGTGNFWTEESYDINEAIKAISFLNVDFLEITFGSRESLENLVLTESSLDLLKKFEFVTIHAPCIPYNEDVATQEILVKLKTLYDQVKAQHISFHPQYFTNFGLLLQYDWNVCIENSRPGKSWDFNKLKNLFKKYSQFGLVLDTCHAGEYSKEEIDLTFNEFNDKIKYFHLSAFYRGVKHQPLHKINEDYLSRFTEIINFGKPLIIELWGTETNLTTIKKELKFLKEKCG